MRRAWAFLPMALLLACDPARADGPTFSVDVKVENTNPDFLLTDTDGPDWAIEADEPVAGAFAIAHQGGGVHAVVIENGAPENSLYLATSGVGIGTGSPAGDLSVSDIDGDGVTDLSLSDLQSANWILTASDGVFRIRHFPALGPTPIYIEADAAGFLMLDTSGASLFGGAGNSLRVTQLGGVHIKGSLIQLSSRESKAVIGEIDRGRVLERLLELPISEWRYHTEGPGMRHLGPTAEDFHAAFGLGLGGDGIPLLDATGIALAAIQGLKAAHDAEIKRLTAEIAALRRLVVSPGTGAGRTPTVAGSFLH